jgi:transglutaminase-like putative cysteine protease
MKSEKVKYAAFSILAIAFILFSYIIINALYIVDKRYTSTKNGTYISYVTTAKEIQIQAEAITKGCDSKLCKVQKLLDFTSNIPYQTTIFQQKSAQRTIQDNFGDCDDKSNLLISMLHSLGIEAYFVLVPKHIFVVVSLTDSYLANIKGLWINGRKYFILESTAKNSKVGYDLKYKLDDIDTIIEPFSNKKVEIKSLEYKL